MKPISMIHLLRLALPAGALLLFGSPVLPAADDAVVPSTSDENRVPPRMRPSPPEGRFDADKGTGPRGRFGHRPEGMSDEMAALEKFLDMSPEQLAMIRNLITRIEQMSDEEKEELRARIRNIREMDADRRQQLMEMHRQVPWEERMMVHQYWKSLSEDERRQIWEETKDMSPEERMAHREVLLERAREAGFDESNVPPPPDRPPFFKRSDRGQGSGEAPGDRPQ